MLERPYTLVAELTYHCPLSCGYCSNPVDHHGGSALDTETWCRVLEEAEALGVMQVHFTGGEPLLRDDLETLVSRARAVDLYSTLITSGIPLARRRLEHLQEAGLDAVQLSIQAAGRDDCDALAGGPVYHRKLTVAQWSRELGLPLTINCVLHRGNIDQVTDIIALAETFGAQRVELANAQYLGWALVNRPALLPDRAALDRARDRARAARARLAGTMEVVFVTPDYYAGFPRACMDGWGRRYLIVTPDGRVLPCHAAHTLPGYPAVWAMEEPLKTIWDDSHLFNAFRGESWMPDLCRTCDRRTIDYGGCRCQAFHLTGAAAATDPACRYSPHHQLVIDARRRAEDPEDLPLIVPRPMRHVP